LATVAGQGGPDCGSDVRGDFFHPDLGPPPSASSLPFQSSMFSSGPDFSSLFGQQESAAISYPTFPSQPFQPPAELGYSAPALGYGAGGAGGAWPSVGGGGADPWSAHPEGDAACQSSLLAALHQVPSLAPAHPSSPPCPPFPPTDVRSA
jgi:hypothetical protein